MVGMLASAHTTTISAPQPPGLKEGETVRAPSWTLGYFTLWLAVGVGLALVVVVVVS